MTRQPKTERQRAEEARDIATRKVQRLMKESARLAANLAAVNSDLEDAKRILDYRQQHPALATPATASTTTAAPTSKETTTP